MEPRKKECRLAALNNHLTTQTLLDFDLDEESSDSDFLPPEQEDSDNEYNSEDGDDDKSDGSDSDDESSASDDLDGLLATSKSTNDQEKKKKEDVSTINLLSILETKRDDSGETKAVIPRKPICCVCLGDRSDDSNEIVECDNCGVTVHEGCYGITESNSISSTASSCSTEPWFCEACRAHLTDLDCELCPNKGGVFKETDCGRWVRILSCYVTISKVNISLRFSRFI